MCGRIAAYTEPQRIARILNAQLDSTTQKSWALWVPKSSSTPSAWTFVVEYL